MSEQFGKERRVPRGKENAARKNRKAIQRVIQPPRHRKEHTVPRHQGVLPDSYQQQLESMDIEQIAIEAAKFRSDGRICGTATAKILQWAKQHMPQEEGRLMALYRAAWQAEKCLRATGKSQRPQERPVKGGRHRFRRDSRARHGFVASIG